MNGHRFWIVVATWLVIVTVVLYLGFQPLDSENPQSYRALNVSSPSH
jgi:hypothetical protein